MEVKNEIALGMHPYISYLLKDIAEALRMEKHCQELEQNFTDILEKIGQMKKERKYIFSYFCELRAEDFLPSD